MSKIDFNAFTIDVGLSSGAIYMNCARLGCNLHCESGILCGLVPIGSNWNRHTQQVFNCKKLEFMIVSEERKLEQVIRIVEKLIFGFGCDNVPIGANWNSETQET